MYNVHKYMLVSTGNERETMYTYKFIQEFYGCGSYFQTHYSETFFLSFEMVMETQFYLAPKIIKSIFNLS